MIEVPRNFKEVISTSGDEQDLSVLAIAKELGCNARTVRNWIRDHGIPVRKRERHNLHLYRLSDIMAVLDSRRTQRSSIRSSRFFRREFVRSKELSITVDGITVTIDRTVAAVTDIGTVVESVLEAVERSTTFAKPTQRENKSRPGELVTQR